MHRQRGAVVICGQFCAMLFGTDSAVSIGAAWFQSICSSGALATRQTEPVPGIFSLRSHPMRQDLNPSQREPCSVANFVQFRLNTAQNLASLAAQGNLLLKNLADSSCACITNPAVACHSIYHGHLSGPSRSTTKVPAAARNSCTTRDADTAPEGRNCANRIRCGLEVNLLAEGGERVCALATDANLRRDQVPGRLAVLR